MSISVDTERSLYATATARWWTGPRVTALGMLILQITWVFAVPPIRGIDEFDHVYRAAAAARGQLFVTPADATRGTGAWLQVPSDIVRAARPQCEDLPYTHAEDCVGTRHGDTTRIASGAGRYHPLFYAVVGVPALPFHGHTAIYVMRLATALSAWLLFCLALGATRRWASTPWPSTALAVASTPVLVYSCSIVSPNGVEMMAGLALWTSALGLMRNPSCDDRYLMVAATVAATVLVTTRSLGPVWCLLTLATVLIATRPSRAGIKVLARRTSSWVGAGVVLVATILSVAWILTMHALNIGQTIDHPISTGHRIHILMLQGPLWLFQSIAAFPHRDEQTRMPVYACYLVLFAGVAYLGFRFARGSVRVAIALAIVMTYAVPFVLGMSPDADPGLWQGRYTLPYAVGIVLLTGFALDRARARLSPRLRAAILSVFVTAQVIGPVDVLRQGEHHQLSDYSQFAHPPAAVLAITAVIGASALLWGASSRRPDRLAA